LVFSTTSDLTRALREPKQPSEKPPSGGFSSFAPVKNALVSVQVLPSVAHSVKHNCMRVTTSRGAERNCDAMDKNRNRRRCRAGRAGMNPRKPPIDATA
jgi:hypothetical protein